MYFEPKSELMRVSVREKKLLKKLRKYEYRGWIGVNEEIEIALQHMEQDLKEYFSKYIEEFLKPVSVLFGKSS